MRINSLKISNVLGIRFAQVNVATPAVLFAGKNRSGKSSIQEAIRMALTGEAARVHLKKEYDQLVTDGAKKGSVEVVVDRETEIITCNMELPAGKGTAADIPVLNFVLDGARFATLSPTERRKFLFDLTGVQVTPEEVAKRLLQREITQARIDAVLPLLRSGFDAAAKEAASKATQAKGAWREITGETHGSKKAETWTADVPAFSQADLEQAEDDLARIEDELAGVAAEKGALQQKQRGDAERAARAEDLRIKASTFAHHTDRLKAAQKEYEAFLEVCDERDHWHSWSLIREANEIALRKELAASREREAKLREALEEIVSARTVTASPHQLAHELQRIASIALTQSSAPASEPPFDFEPLNIGDPVDCPLCGKPHTYSANGSICQACIITANAAAPKEPSHE